MEKDFLACACGGQRFANARRLYFIDLPDGHRQRNWASGENDSSEVVCDRCGTVYVWNSIRQVYEHVVAAPPPATRPA